MGAEIPHRVAAQDVNMIASSQRVIMFISERRKLECRKAAVVSPEVCQKHADVFSCLLVDYR